MLDQQLTKDIAAWLNLSPEERDIEAGALLLLRINRNRFLYNNIVARPKALADKLEAELKKYLRIRRADNNQLTDDIKTVYDRELERHKKIKATFECLKSIFHQKFQYARPTTHQ